RERAKSRPSLSDRTIESLQNLPSTPRANRRSSFFSHLESPRGLPPRPASALSRNGSSHSRPGTSDGNFSQRMKVASPAKRITASAKPASRTVDHRATLPTPQRRSVSTSFTAKLQARRDDVPPVPNLPSHMKQGTVPAASLRGQTNSKPLNGSNTLVTRTPRSRPTLEGAFERADAKGPSLNRTPIKSQKPSTPSKGGAPSSSAALREQIAAAKAAARKQQAKHDSPQQADFDHSEASSHADPFNQAHEDNMHILRNRIRTAWTDGKLNIAGIDLQQIPDEVLRMYDPKVLEDANINWAEVIDLTKLVAADNELASLGDDVFPDGAAAEDDANSPFGGLETLDLHGNLLQSLPVGLRRLERLTTLSLAHNKLENSCLNVIVQITTLKDLRLGHNQLSGHLPATVSRLSQLEHLDLQSNRLLGLPESLRELSMLKVLHVSSNQLTTVPMDALEQVPLIELDVSGNALIGSLFPPDCSSAHATLRTLSVANNSLAALTFSDALDLPRLQSLDVTNNHLTALPSVAGWTELVTIAAGENKMQELPEGFVTLPSLRTANFTSNELRLLDPELARMDNLQTLILAANPLREKKYLSMSAADIKHDLIGKLEPESVEDGAVSAVEAAGGSADATSKAFSWALKARNVLDLAGKVLSDDINDGLGSFLQSNEVWELHVNTNRLTVVPPALWLAQDLRILDVSHNTFGPDYLVSDLELPALQELTVSHCGLTTLEPLMSQLSAPALTRLDITANRLTGPVPKLRTVFLSLETLLAGEAKFTSVSADAIRGLHTVNLANNDLQALPAQIGLLWDEGLRNLEVGGNAFRVPSYRVLEKGTEATLRWLRDKLPA
ncbi:hypothetical protein BAUCODRAFT_43747, partial [Baudoinia panamericana UAMH 10762]